jgi:hypothetical protein
MIATTDVHRCRVHIWSMCGCPQVSSFEYLGTELVRGI